MSISHEQFNGGAVAVTTSTQLATNSPRVVSCYNSSSINVDLPDPAPLRANQSGGPWFRIMRHGAGSVVVRTHAGATLVTLGSSQTCLVNLGPAGFKLVRVQTIGTARTAGHGSRPSVTNPAPTSAPLPICADKDRCELAEFEGNVPGDGQDGRPSIVVPMIQDIVMFARNAAREPVRAADVVMPTVVVVKLDPSDFVVDADHPGSATVLSQGFYDALYNANKAHALKYVDPGVDPPGTTSRHPLHVRYWANSLSGTSGWSHGDGATALQVTRHRWQKTIQYKDADDVTRTARLVFVSEHLLSSGKMNRNYGAWGAVFSLFVFTDELYPSFVDGSSYTPAGSSGAVSFTLKDPIVSGVALGQPNSDPKLRMCHPQMVACAHLPTSYHAGFSSKWVPLNERRYGRNLGGTPNLEMKNLEYCYRRKGQSPFTTPGACTTIEAPASPSFDPFCVTAFGWSDGPNTSGATYTFGGDFDPKSKPMEFFVWENALQVGQTYMAPIKAGWNELCGTLDVGNGSSGDISLCTEDEWGIADDTGTRVWDATEYIECAGHPDEPLETVGGGHKCFNNGNNTGDSTVANCCVTIGPVAAVANNECYTTTTTYEEQYDDTMCKGGSVECKRSMWAWSSRALDVEDYSYNISDGGDLPGGASGASMSWVRYLPHPDAKYFNVTHTDTAPDFTDAIGTMTRSTLTVATAGSGTNAPHSAFTYSPASEFTSAGAGAMCSGVLSDLAQGDYEVLASLDGSNRHILGGRLYLDGFGVATCVVAEITPTGGTNATLSIVKWSSGTRTVLKTANITNYAAGAVVWHFRLWGAEFSLWSTDLSVSLTAYDCEAATWSGYPFIGGQVGASFSAFSVVDRNKTRYLSEISAAMGRLSLDLSFPCELQHLHTIRGCHAVHSNPDCGNCCEPAVCNCSDRLPAPHFHTSASWQGHTYSPPRDIVMPACVSSSSPTGGDYGVDGDNPTRWGGALPRCSCNGRWCPGLTWYCGECPYPFPTVGLYIPSRCVDASGNPANVPNMCFGIQRWTYSIITCY